MYSLMLGDSLFFSVFTHIFTIFDKTKTVFLVLTAVIVPANSNLKLVLQIDQEERQTNSVWIPQKAKMNSVNGEACCEMQSY